MRPASDLVEIKYGDDLETLRRCGGYYICPKDKDGKRLGPLVGYAGKYDDEDGRSIQYVGDVYFNFAKAEEYHHVLYYFAISLASKIKKTVGMVDYVIGAPMGGIAIAKDVARYLDCRFIFAEKKVTALATKESREQSVLILNRHEIETGARTVIVEDVCNNFSTTEQLVKLIAYRGGYLACIACELNRSPVTGWWTYPVVSMLHVPTKQYRQDDPEVSEDISRGNVVWKPKDEWPKIMEVIKSVQRN